MNGYACGGDYMCIVCVVYGTCNVLVCGYLYIYVYDAHGLCVICGVCGKEIVWCTMCGVVWCGMHHSVQDMKEVI